MTAVIVNTSAKTLDVDGRPRDPKFIVVVRPDGASLDNQENPPAGNIVVAQGRAYDASGDPVDSEFAILLNPDGTAFSPQDIAQTAAEGIDLTAILDTDPTLSANSDEVAPSQKAMREYIASILVETSISDETLSYIGRMDVAPNDLFVRAIDKYVRHMTYADAYDYCDGWYLSCLHDDQTIVLNLVGDVYEGTNTGMTFTAGQGVAGDNTGATYVSYAFNPSTAGGKLEAGDAFFSVYRHSNPDTGDDGILGGVNSTFYIIAWDDSAIGYSRLNVGEVNPPTTPQKTGLLTVRRDGDNIAALLDGARLGTVNTGAPTIANGDLRTGSIAAGGSSAIIGSTIFGGNGAPDTFHRNCAFAHKNLLQDIAAGQATAQPYYTSTIWENDGRHVIVGGMRPLPSGRILAVIMADGALVAKISANHGKERSWGDEFVVDEPAVNNYYYDPHVGRDNNGALVVSATRLNTVTGVYTAVTFRVTENPNLSLNISLEAAIVSVIPWVVAASDPIPLLNGLLCQPIYSVYPGQYGKINAVFSENGGPWGDEVPWLDGTVGTPRFWSELTGRRLSSGMLRLIIRNRIEDVEAGDGFYEATVSADGQVCSEPTLLFGDGIADAPGWPHAIARPSDDAEIFGGRFNGNVSLHQCTGFTFTRDRQDWSTVARYLWNSTAQTTRLFNGGNGGALVGLGGFWSLERDAACFIVGLGGIVADAEVLYQEWKFPAVA